MSSTGKGAETNSVATGGEKSPISRQALEEFFNTNGMKVPKGSNRLRDVLANAVADELSDYTAEDLGKVLEITTVLIGTGMYMFFSPKVVAMNCDAVGNHLAIRRFYSGLHLRVHAALLGEELYEDRGSAKMVYGASMANILDSFDDLFGENSHMADSVKASVYSSWEDLKALLENNPWLVTLYLTFSLKAFELGLSRLANS